MRACYNCEPNAWGKVYGPKAHRKLLELVKFKEPAIPANASREDFLARVVDAEVIFSTWGCHPIDSEVLELCPDLKLVLHGAGSVKPFVTDEFLAKGIPFSSAVEVNARPVAEYCLGIILTAMKDVFRSPRKFGKNYTPEKWYGDNFLFRLGYYDTKVGLVGYGRIAKYLLKLLQPFDFNVYVHSPYFGPEEETSTGAKNADLDWIFKECDIVSLHMAATEADRHIVNQERLSLMKEGAYFLNTARGTLVDEKALLNELGKRDIFAILDVLDPEPPAPDNPLLHHPNCIVTSHVSGSIGPEIQRMGDFVVQELKDFLSDGSLNGLVELDMLASMA